MTAADRPAAPELSPAEAKFLDRPEAEEGLRERVAAAMRATRECQAGMAFGVPLDARTMFLAALADAAITATTQPAEGAPAAPDPVAAVNDGAAADVAVGEIAERYRDPALARFAINDFRDWLRAALRPADVTGGQR